MKAIKLLKGEMFSSKQVLTEVMAVPVNGCNIADMRRRMRVMDAIEAASFDESSGGGELTLEDADYELLKSAFHQNQFRLVHRDLLAIADSLT
jgi:hypothetical protein